MTNKIGRSNKQIDRCLFFCWPWVSIWFLSAGAQPRSAEEVAALDEDFYQRDVAAKYEDFYQRDVAAEYEDLDFDACEQFDDDDVDLGQNEVDAGGRGFAADDDDDVVDERAKCAKLTW